MVTTWLPVESVDVVYDITVEVETLVMTTLVVEGSATAEDPDDPAIVFVTVASSAVVTGDVVRCPSEPVPVLIDT
jgi:hypothetical protein